jgi:hypothetical protein
MDPLISFVSSFHNCFLLLYQWLLIIGGAVVKNECERERQKRAVSKVHQRQCLRFSQQPLHWSGSRIACQTQA